MPFFLSSFTSCLPSGPWFHFPHPLLCNFHPVTELKLLMDPDPKDSSPAVRMGEWGSPTPCETLPPMLSHPFPRPQGLQIGLSPYLSQDNHLLFSLVLPSEQWSWVLLRVPSLFLSLQVLIWPFDLESWVEEFIAAYRKTEKNTVC